MKLGKSRKKQHDHDKSKNKKENINPLKMPVKVETKPIAVAHSNLQKWSSLFQDETGFGFGFSPSDNSPLRKKVAKPVIPDLTLNPTCPNTKTDFVGTPINLATAQSLRKLLFGNTATLFTSDWRKSYFKFRDTKSSIPYGLESNFAGPRPVVMAIQAQVLNYLLFSDEFGNDDESKSTFKKPPTPDGTDQEIALAEAVVNVIWTASPVVPNKENNFEHRESVVAIPGDDDCFKSDGYFVADGFTERLWLYTVYTKDDLRKLIKRNIFFFKDRYFPGCILLTYSVVLSRTPLSILKDLGGWQDSLLTENSRPTQAFINLMLTGRATSFIHNNTLHTDEKGKTLNVPRPGLQKRSEIGFLFFTKAEIEKKRTMVGSMYKTPLVPIWVTQVNGSFGILFCTSLNLVRDWRSELYFTLHYYTGHFSQVDPSAITLDTRTRVAPITKEEISIWDDEEEKEKKQPSLELCIGTKWPECLIDWNGETPYY